MKMKYIYKNTFFSVKYKNMYIFGIFILSVLMYMYLFILFTKIY